MKYREDSFYIEKALAGNLPAYGVLIEKHSTLAYTLAFRIAKNHEDAEEIAQDAFLKGYQSLAVFRQEAKFTTWLYKIIFTTAMSRFRKKHPDFQSTADREESFASEVDEPDGLELLQKDERKKIIADAIGRLKEDEAVALTLFYMNEASIREIEEITGFTSSNIKILLHRGRKNLLMELKKSLKQEIVDII
jgi:RNA polymerase sigma factor (sigma-70 family)